MSDMAFATLTNEVEVLEIQQDQRELRLQRVQPFEER